MAPDLLKHLPLNTQKELLFILNASWTTGWCPQVWRTATIVPFLKKDPQAVISYRPIALTSTIWKLLERLIFNRLFWGLEAKSLLSPWQAGYRKRRHTTDQCLRLSQFVSDGFQSTNKERTVLMLFDYSKAYDTVWRTGLLQKMLDIGVPLRFVQWTTAWITNRITRVQLNGVLGDAVPSRKDSRKVQYFHRYSSCSTSTIFSGISANPPWLVLTLMISL